MFHNIKADIIYYKTATDFELEFNLCGCCRMRLLSDKMQDKKSFVHSLARAVQRSSVILIAGSLFGEEGSIKTVAEAINTTTELVDNNAFGILNDGEIEIIKGGTPLVTSDGYFGGCIIESGPQTMILLTDNKNLRKDIMKNLIHPYIAELYAAESTNTNQEVNNDSVADEPITDIILDEPEEEIIQPEACENDIIESEIIMDDGEEDAEYDEIEDEESVDLFFEPTKLDRRTAKLYTEQYLENSDDYDKSDYTYQIPKKNNLALCVLIISIILLLVVAVLCYCIFIVPARHDIAPVAYLQDIFQTMFS